MVTLTARCGTEHRPISRPSCAPSSADSKDGGLWNNLATAWDEEQERIRNKLDHELPLGLRSPVDLHVVVDASAPVRRVSSTKLAMPLVGWCRGTGRGFKAMLQSSIAYHRRQLGWHSQWSAGGRTSHVNLHINPHDICPISALLTQLGPDEERWRGVAERARRVRTNLLGVERERATSVVAHAYGLTSAHLADGWSVPFVRFSDPTRRFV